MQAAIWFDYELGAATVLAVGLLCLTVLALAV
jgi:hypothetical protein